MGIKCIFMILLVILPLCFIGCRGPEIRRDEIPCKAASAISSSATANGKITIAWDTNTDEKLAGHKVYYGFSSKKYKECVDIGNPTESSPGVIKFTLIGLERGKKYYIAVITYDKNNNRSLFSSEVSTVAE